MNDEKLEKTIQNELYYQEHREEILKKRRARYAANKDKEIARAMEYNKTHRGVFSRRQSDKNYRESHKEQIKAGNKAYRENNHERELERHKEYHLKRKSGVRNYKVSSPIHYKTHYIDFKNVLIKHWKKEHLKDKRRFKESRKREIPVYED